MRSVAAAGFDSPPMDVSFACNTGNKQTRGMKTTISLVTTKSLKLNSYCCGYDLEGSYRNDKWVLERSCCSRLMRQ